MAEIDFNSDLGIRRRAIARSPTRCAFTATSQGRPASLVAFMMRCLRPASS
jgi:hypothetical protein